MNLSYTKLAILLLRVQGLITIVASIPSVTSTLISILTRGDEFRKFDYSYQWGFFLQPIIGIIIFIFAVPLASKAAGFLDSAQNEK